MPSAIKSYSLSIVRGLTASEVSKLKKAGIDNTAELLAAATSTTAEQKLAKTVGIPLNRMREAVNRADLMQVAGMGAARADLFENIGVNSAKELAQRNPATLAATIAKYVKAHPELNYRLPSPITVASLVAKAKELSAPVPTPATGGPVKTMAEAIKIGEAAMHRYIDDVLFNVNNPEGAAFREMCLEWRPSSEWHLSQAQLHKDVPTFLNVKRADDANQSPGYDEQRETATQFIIYGRLFGLYSEVVVDKADGKIANLLVEVD